MSIPTDRDPIFLPIPINPFDFIFLKGLDYSYNDGRLSGSAYVSNITQIT